jgi:hypothetical protein
LLVLRLSGWRWFDNKAVSRGGYWLCATCSINPEGSAVMVALREPHG